jgi:serine/arginine repetitive matrix protein 2
MPSDGMSHGVVPDESLDRIHASMRREPLTQARNPTHSTMPGQLILLKRTVPSRITYRLQSETLPRIHSFCEGVFPYYIHCSWLQDLPFSCLGPSALLYSGPPLSSPVVIERSFMHSTFQVAFMNHQVRSADTCLAWMTPSCGTTGRSRSSTRSIS